MSEEGEFLQTSIFQFTSSGNDRSIRLTIHIPKKNTCFKGWFLFILLYKSTLPLSNKNKTVRCCVTLKMYSIHTKNNINAINTKMYVENIKIKIQKKERKIQPQYI